MKSKSVFTAAISLAAASHFALAQTHSNDHSLETNGTVERFIMNPEGDIDGLLLSNGTQVNFPPHMSSQLTAVVARKDAVSIRGFRENAKVFKAEKITNVKTTQSVVEVEPALPSGEPAGAAGGPPPPPPPPRGGPGGPGPRGGPLAREGLKPLSAQGKIEAQIFGRRGEVNGLILSDNSIVRFGPRMTDSHLKTDIGQNIKAAGFGTQNSYGKAIEATELTNK